MNKLQQIVAYFCLNYPHKSELSNARLTKLVYLSDWFSSLLYEYPISNIEWIFNHYGPYIDDVINSVRSSYNFNIRKEKTIYGSDKYVIIFNGDEDEIELLQKEINILDAVIEKTEKLYFNEFIQYVYSTYPVVSRERYSVLNLTELAKEYNNNNQCIW